MTTKLGPWPLGIDNLSGRGALGRNQDGIPVALADAANVDIDRSGRPRRRYGRSQVLAGGVHSAWSCPLGSFAVAGDQLCRVSVSGLTPITTLNSADPCTYAVLNDELVVANRTTLLRVQGNTVRPVAVPVAAAPTVVPVEMGGLHAGRYGVAVAAMRDGEEGALSPLRTVTIDTGGGIGLTADLPTGATHLRVYRTQAGGATLYRHADLPASVAGYVLGNADLGIDAGTRNLRPLPTGEHVAAWNGRLLVASGKRLIVGEALRYGLHSPRHGIVQFAERIAFIAPVSGGLFVGLRSTVVFLRGAKPKDWVQESTGAAAPVPRSVATLRPDERGLDIPGDAVTWLSRAGYCIGTGDGQVIAPQSTRLALPQYEAGATCIHQRRVLTAVM